MTVSRKSSDGYNGHTKKIDKRESTFVMPEGGERYTLSNGVSGTYFGPPGSLPDHIAQQEKIQAKKAAGKWRINLTISEKQGDK